MRPAVALQSARWLGGHQLSQLVDKLDEQKMDKKRERKQASQGGPHGSSIEARSKRMEWHLRQARKAHWPGHERAVGSSRGRLAWLGGWRWQKSGLAGVA